MKTTGIINAQLAAAIARLRHTDRFIVADAGLPVPDGTEVIDLAVIYGVPGFCDVLDAILAETTVEHALIACEAASSPAGAWLAERFPHAEQVPHDAFKRDAAHAAFLVRTGEATPFANVMLRAGVPF